MCHLVYEARYLLHEATIQYFCTQEEHPFFTSDVFFQLSLSVA